MATVNISGVDDIVAGLRTFGAGFTGKVSKRAAAKAAILIRDEAKRQCRAQGLVWTGAILRNIVVKADRRPRGEIGYHVGVRHGREAFKAKTASKVVRRKKGGGLTTSYVNDPFYWWFHEFGAPGANLPARPFMRPAFEAKRGAALDMLTAVLADAVANPSKVKP